VICTRSRKLKVEFYDADGVKHTISVDGPVSKEKVGRILDLVEIMSGTLPVNATALGLSGKKLDRLASSILSHLRDRQFSSSEAKSMFERTFGEKIPISTVSTYLGRLVDKGLLDRRPGSEGLRYSVRLEQQPLGLPPPSSQSF
jgi:hypothetical protein